jgi:O-antigen/teichoic acid export membrane protein
MPILPPRIRAAVESRARELRTALRLVRSPPFDTSTPDGRANERYRRILLTSGTSVLSRAAGSLVSLLVMPVVLAYLGKEQFGLWAAITSTVAWIGLFDFGLANGLVNAISEANGRDDRAAAREYVSTAMAMLLGSTLVLAVLAAAGVGAVSWDSLLGAQGKVPGPVVTRSVAAALAIVIAGLPLSIVHQVYVGYQRSYVSSAFDFVGHVLVIAGAVAVVRLGGSLPALVLAFGGATLVASLANLAWLLAREMPWLRPGLAAVSRRALRRLTATSVPLFLFQLGALLVNQSQNLVLARRAGLGTVAEYSLLWRLYVVVMSVILMSTSSFIPSFREAVERGDAAWARRTFGHFLRLRMVLAGGACLAFLVVGNLVLRIWLRRADIQFDWAVWTALCVTCLASVWVTSYVDMLNVMDQIWPQLWLVLVNGAITVALTWVLGPRWGVLGAVVSLGATVTLLGAWAYPRLARGVLDERAAGQAAGGPDRPASA